MVVHRCDSYSVPLAGRIANSRYIWKLWSDTWPNCRVKNSNSAKNPQRSGSIFLFLYPNHHSNIEDCCEHVSVCQNRSEHKALREKCKRNKPSSFLVTVWKQPIGLQHYDPGRRKISFLQPYFPSLYSSAFSFEERICIHFPLTLGVWSLSWATTGAVLIIECLCEEILLCLSSVGQNSNKLC